MPRRRTRHLRWVRPPGLDAGEEAILGLYAAPRDAAAHLLHVGAEIEHALAVQYLYAAYSLDPAAVSPPHQALVQGWRSTLLEIAREEMAHLATVQNLLTAIGSPLTFERDDFPIPTELYPFPFELQKLTKRSLASYVLAEMPDEKTVHELGLDAELDAVRLTLGLQGASAVHRVGRLYAQVEALFSSADAGPNAALSTIAPSDIQAESLVFQVRPAEWGLWYKDLLIMTASDQGSAVAAIQAIAEQGEGATLQDYETSHFGRFLEIYKVFPDENDWQPARNVATNPTTDPSAPGDRRITGEAACLWAGLFNVRYRMLLMFLSHSFRLEAPSDATGRTPRGLLVTWAFGEMYNLRSIANLLMRLPLNGEGAVFAGPPFELPYSLALPPRHADCWRIHRDLLQTSQRFVQELRRHSRHAASRYLDGLARANAGALAQIETILGG